MMRGKEKNRLKEQVTIATKDRGRNVAPNLFCYDPQGRVWILSLVQEFGFDNQATSGPAKA